MRDLETVGRWFTRIFPGAYQSPNGSWRASAEEAGRADQYEEDLTIGMNPATGKLGIVDRAVWDMGDAREGRRTPIDVVMQFVDNVKVLGMPDPVRAAHWLCEAIGVSPERLGWQSGGTSSQRPRERVPLIPAEIVAPEFPVDALGPRLAPVAKAISRKTQSREEIAAQSLLTVSSLAVQGHRDVMLPFGQKRPLSIYAMTIAESGDRKSSSDSEARRPVNLREDAMREEHEIDMSSWRIQHSAWTGEKKKIENSRKNISFEERKRQLEALGEEPARPLLPILTTGDLTVEGLTKEWSNAPASLGIFSAEGSIFLGGYGMSEDNKKKTCGALSELWDGTAPRRVRAGDGVIILRGRRLAVHILVQSEILRLPNT